jgi:hypothetical protein
MNAAATAEATRVRMVVIGISPAFQNSVLAAGRGANGASQQIVQLRRIQYLLQEVQHNRRTLMHALHPQ